MAWFGEQFSSLTGKLSDFTKEVLIDHGNNEQVEDVSHKNYELSLKELLELCKEKDAQIELLMNEKASLEKNIEELDLQHEEAVNELLHLKNQAVQDNAVLKQELATLAKRNSDNSTGVSKSLLQSFEHDLDCDKIRTKFNDSTSISAADYNISMKNINLVNILGIIWRSISEGSVSNFIKWLEDQKLLLETQVKSADDCSINNTVARINNYINFLHQISETPEVFSPVLDEIAAVIYFLLSNNIKLNDKLTISHAEIDENSVPSSETTDFSSQTDMYDFKHAKIYLSSMPEPFLCNNSNGTNSNSNELCSSHHSQTDDEENVQNCNALLFELRQYAHVLMQEKSDLQEEVVRLQSLPLPPPPPAPSLSDVMVQTDESAFNLETPSTQELEMYICILEQEKADLMENILELKSLTKKCTTSVIIQTDNNFDSDGDSIVNLQELQNHLNILQQENSDLHNQVLQLQNMLDKSTFSVLCQTDDVNFNLDTSEVQELQSHVNIIQQEKCDLQNKILELQSVVDKSTLSALSQTDEYVNCNVHELEACICILEQEKADLNEEISQLKSMLNKTSSSVSVQTDEDSSFFEFLQEEIRTLNETMCMKERNFNDSLKKLKGDLDNLEKELEYKDIVISKKENTIISLKLDLEDCKTSIRALTENLNLNKMCTSVEIQTDENNCSCEVYEMEIAELQKTIFEKNEKFIAFEDKMLEDFNKMKCDLYSKECLIKDNESVFNSLNLEIEKYKCEIERLHSEMSELKSYMICNSCNHYESELVKLKACLDEKEKTFNVTQNEYFSSINNLKESLKNKESLIREKDDAIEALKLELEEIRENMIQSLADDLSVKKQDYAKDIDTSEEYGKVIVESCNKCKNILNGEAKENDFKNEMKSLQEKLKILDTEKNQLLCVLNEKTQECSTLKAEVHKLTNIVASEKQALNKLQQDNCMLRESRDNSDPELTKEAIQKLSNIIRDKDLEIESLKQKNSTLTTLIQDASSVPDHMQSLIEEKENLTKQINVFKADRDKIMVYYNAADKDCRQYAAEVKKLQAALSDQKEKFDVLEQKHFSVAQQYEEKQKSLINTQNEMIALKQRVSDLEQQQVDIKEKYSELLNKLNSDTMVQVTKDEYEEKNSQIQQLINANSEKDHLIQEKDCLIHDLSQQIKSLKLEYEQQQVNLSNLQAKVEELTNNLKDHEALIKQLQNEKEAFDLRYQDKNSELALLKEMNERLNMTVKEKEFAIQSMTKKISSLSHYISSDHTTSDTLDINQILSDSESIFSKAQMLYKERDETLLALNQSKQENQNLRNEIQRMKSNEIHLKKELERLRTHLLEIEENYTHEALKAEKREKQLRDELIEVKHHAEISSTAVVDTNQRASIQIASLQEQLSMIANQRDQALAQVSTLEDKVQQHSAAISKLQLVLEQMQRGNERKVKEKEKKFTALLENKQKLYRELEEKLQEKELQLEESSQALEAATRLSEQLDAKEEIIANLKSELSKTENKIKSTAKEIDTIKSNTEGKVDRVVMKSLVLGYFSTPPGQKSEVIRLLARVLDFNQEEMEKAGIVVGRSAQRNEQRGILSSIFSRLPSLSSEKSQPAPEKSFTTLFVQFLENESQPIVPMPFPAAKMVQELPFKSHSNKKSPTTQRKNMSRSNPLLLDIDSAFPTFSPVPAVEYSQSPAQSILREVLE